MGTRFSRHRGLAAALGVSALFAMAGFLPAAATAASLPPPGHPRPGAPALPRPGPPMQPVPGIPAQPAPSRNPAAGCSAGYFHGDPRLGPARLPATGPLGDILHGYHRLGGLSASAFLTAFWNPSAAAGHGGWRYPPQDGYVLGRSGRAEVFELWLIPGQRMDRFGQETGSFLSPYGQPFAIRALPPSSLDGTGCDYHAYRVARRFLVDAGPVARWFRQPGYGFQYHLDGALVPGAPATLSVGWLVRRGYLSRLG